jgi:hypothetical protein
MMVNAKLVRRIQEKKAKILTPIVYATMKPGDTSSEAMDIAMKYTTDQTVVDLILERVTKLLEVDDVFTIPASSEEQLTQECYDDFEDDDFDIDYYEDGDDE